MAFTLKSSAFQAGDPIPVRFTGDGEDVSPPLEWSGAPEGTVEFALLCEDPDAPRPQPFVHWLVYGIPGTATSLGERVTGEVHFGLNDFGEVGWGGPEPPEGTGAHRYRFRLYALSKNLKLEAGASKPQLLAGIGEPLATADLIGTYARGAVPRGIRAERGRAPRLSPGDRPKTK